MDYQPYLTRLKKEKARNRKLALERRERALRAIPKISNLLKKKFEVDKVYLFGSCISSEYFHQRSDVDIGVQSLSSDNYLTATYDVNTLEHGFKVDLINMKTCDDDLRNKILREGREI